MQKNLIAVIVLAVFILAVVLFFVLNRKEKPPIAPEGVALETNVTPPSVNPLNEVKPSENPVDKTNPFKHENPFE